MWIYSVLARTIERKEKAHENARWNVEKLQCFNSMNGSNLISFQIFSIYFSLYAVIALSSGKLVAIAWCEQNQWISCKNLHLRSKGTHSLSISHWEALNKRNWNSHNCMFNSQASKISKWDTKSFNKMVCWRVNWTMVLLNVSIWRHCNTFHALVCFELRLIWKVISNGETFSGFARLWLKTQTIF